MRCSWKLQRVECMAV